MREMQGMIAEMEGVCGVEMMLLVLQVRPLAANIRTLSNYCGYQYRVCWKQLLKAWD
jgi:hypothetical protein